MGLLSDMETAAATSKTAETNEKILQALQLIYNEMSALAVNTKENREILEELKKCNSNLEELMGIEKQILARLRVSERA